MRKIAVLNQKGGVGKTTTVANIAAALTDIGQRVVAIDLDPQAHLTIHFGLNPETIEAGSYKVLTQSAKFEEQIMLVRKNLWLLPANINLVGAETELVSVVGRETILRQALVEAEDHFDYLIVDCAPSLGLLTLNALAAVDEILIPIQPHFLALQGFGKLLQTVDLVNKRINHKLKVKNVLLCMFDTTASLPAEVKADIAKFLENARSIECPWSQAEVLPIHIRRNIKLAEAPSYGKTIFEYARHCHGAQDYREVAELIHNQSQPTEPHLEPYQSPAQPPAENHQRQPDVQPQPETQPFCEQTEPQPSAASISPEQPGLQPPDSDQSTPQQIPNPQQITN